MELMVLVWRSLSSAKTWVIHTEEESTTVCPNNESLVLLSHVKDILMFRRQVGGVCEDAAVVLAGE